MQLGKGVEGLLIDSIVWLEGVLRVKVGLKWMATCPD